jgi:hypothetical protein
MSYNSGYGSGFAGGYNAMEEDLDEEITQEHAWFVINAYFDAKVRASCCCGLCLHTCFKAFHAKVGEMIYF